MLFFVREEGKKNGAEKGEYSVVAAAAAVVAVTAVAVETLQPTDIQHQTSLTFKRGRC